jgi:hypothetical protein
MKKRLILSGSAALVFCGLLVFWRLLILAFNIPDIYYPRLLKCSRQPFIGYRICGRR